MKQDIEAMTDKDGSNPSRVPSLQDLAKERIVENITQDFKKEESPDSYFSRVISLVSQGITAFPTHPTYRADPFKALTAELYKLTQNNTLNKIVGPDIVLAMIQKGAPKALEYYLKLLNEEVINYIKIWLMENHWHNTTGLDSFRAVLILFAGQPQQLDAYYERAGMHQGFLWDIATKYNRKCQNQEDADKQSQVMEVFKQCWLLTNDDKKNSFIKEVVDKLPNAADFTSSHLGVDVEVYDDRSYDMYLMLTQLLDDQDDTLFASLMRADNWRLFNLMFEKKYQLTRHLVRCIRVFGPQELSEDQLRRIRDLAIDKQDTAALVLLAQHAMPTPEAQQDVAAHAERQGMAAEDINPQTAAYLEAEDKQSALLQHITYHNWLGVSSEGDKPKKALKSTAANALDTFNHYAMTSLPNGGFFNNRLQGQEKRRLVIQAFVKLLDPTQEHGQHIPQLCATLTTLLQAKANEGIRVNRGTGLYVVYSFFFGVRNPFDDKYSRSSSETRAIRSYQAMHALSPENFKNNAGKTLPKSFS